MNLQAPLGTITEQEESPAIIATLDAQEKPQLSRREGLAVVLLLSVLTWAPLLYPGFIQTHSGLGAAYDALSARLPFSAWLPAHATSGDGPLASWLLAAVAVVSGPVAGLKLLYAASFMLAGAGMFLLARRLWGGQAAIVAAAVYMLVPYRIAAVYVRGDLAETLLLGAAPFLFVALQEALAVPRQRNLVVVALLAALLVLTNFGLGFLVITLSLLWGVLYKSSEVSETSELSNIQTTKRSLLPALIAALIGLVAAAIVLLPAGGRILANMPGWHDHFVYFFQLFAPTWGFGESVPGWQDGMTFQLGLVPVALAILALWGVLEPAWREEQKNTTDEAPGIIPSRQERRTVLLLCLFAAVLILLTVTFAAPLWRILPLSALVAYPWQLLGLAAIFLALLAGAALHALSPDGRPALTMVAVVLAATVLGSYSYLSPRFIDQAGLPDLSHPPLAQLGDNILLLDARVSSEPTAGSLTGKTEAQIPVTVVHAGGTLYLRLTWQALRQPAADFTTFAQLFDAQGAKRGQQDVRPHNGDKPTNTWLRGEVVSDDISIPVAADAPPGEYSLQVGMYLLATMQRLPVSGTQNNTVTLGSIIVQ